MISGAVRCHERLDLMATIIAAIITAIITAIIFGIKRHATCRVATYIVCHLPSAHVRKVTCKYLVGQITRPNQRVKTYDGLPNYHQTS